MKQEVQHCLLSSCFSEMSAEFRRSTQPYVPEDSTSNPTSVTTVRSTLQAAKIYALLNAIN